MHECTGCIYEDNDTDEQPCYKCLSSYLGRPYYKAKSKSIVKEQPKKDPSEEFMKDENTPLPWEE